MMTSTLSLPMTMMLALQLAKGSEALCAKRLSFHLLGATEASECFALSKYEELLHCLPSLRCLHIALIGPEVPPHLPINFRATDPEDGHRFMCDTCFHGGRQLLLTFHPTCYHEATALAPAPASKGLDLGPGPGPGQEPGLAAGGLDLGSVLAPSLVSGSPAVTVEQEPVPGLDLVLGWQAADVDPGPSLGPGREPVSAAAGVASGPGLGLAEEPVPAPAMATLHLQPGPSRGPVQGTPVAKSDLRPGPAQSPATVLGPALGTGTVDPGPDLGLEPMLPPVTAEVDPGADSGLNPVVPPASVEVDLGPGWGPDRQPDLVLALNCGFSEHGDDAAANPWLDSLAALRDTGRAVAFTGFNAREAKDDEGLLCRLGIRVVVPPQDNPFRSMVPLPEPFPLAGCYYVNATLGVFQGAVNGLE